MSSRRCVRVNGEEIDISCYWQMHERRFVHSISTLRRFASGKTLEIGGHPWAMTSLIAETPELQLAATVSAEEVTKWPDNIGAKQQSYTIVSVNGRAVTFNNYSLNIERDLVDLDCKFDTIVACEVIEHLIRAPHVMLLNINRWLNLGGTVLLTTPNGAQFNNPLRLKNARPAFRCYAYERHNCLFTLPHLEDLVLRSGFSIVESGYWNVYDRVGISQLYAFINRLPGKYIKAKFSRTVYVIAKKVEDTSEIRGCPIAYSDHPDWEYISRV